MHTTHTTHTMHKIQNAQHTHTHTHTQSHNTYNTTRSNLITFRFSTAAVMEFGLSYKALQQFFSPIYSSARTGDSQESCWLTGSKHRDDGWNLLPKPSSSDASDTADYQVLFRQICPASASTLLPSVFAIATEVSVTRATLPPPFPPLPPPPFPKTMETIYSLDSACSSAVK